MAFSQFFTAKLFSGEINNDENNEDHWKWAREISVLMSLCQNSI